jgi:glycerophosphoryl diester phosphodiesterase
MTTADEIKKLHHVSRYGVTDEPVSLLSQAVAVIQNDVTHLRELQLDLKPFSPPNAPILEDLLMIIGPIKERIRISSVADWVLRHLKVLDPELSLGFDPLLYFDLNVDQYLSSNLPPFRIGPYGYRDDHPLSALKWGTPTDYLASRAEALLAQIPSHTLWYMRAPLIARSLDDGFDWIDFLHQQETKVVAWTLNPDNVHQASLAQRLTDAGIDRISTDDAPNLANVLRGVIEL